MIAYARKDMNKVESDDSTKVNKSQSSETNKPKFTISNIKYGNNEIEDVKEGKLETSMILYKKLRVLVTYNSEYKNYGKDRSESSFPENIHVSRFGVVKGVEYFKQKLQLLVNISGKDRLINLDIFRAQRFKLSQDFQIDGQKLIYQVDAIESTLFFFAKKQIGDRADNHRFCLYTKRKLKFLYFLQSFLNPFSNSFFNCSFLLIF